MQNIYDVFKMKVNGMKKKVRFLQKDEVIQDGDFHMLVCNYKNTITDGERETFMQKLKDNKKFSLLETRAQGDLVSDHPLRVYLRIVNW